MKSSVRVAFCGFFLVSGLLAGQPVRPIDSFWENWKSQCLWKLNSMAQMHEVSDNEAYFIKNYLEEQDGAVELFGKYGSQGPTETRAKIREILDITRTQISMVLSPEQLEQWSKWERLFSSRRPIYRRVPPPPR